MQYMVSHISSFTKVELSLILLGIEQNRFGWKADKIAKFNILDGKTEFSFGRNLDKKWANGQLIARKIVKLFLILGFTIMFLQLV